MAAPVLERGGVTPQMIEHQAIKLVGPRGSGMFQSELPLPNQGEPTPPKNTVIVKTGRKLRYLGRKGTTVQVLHDEKSAIGPGKVIPVSQVEVVKFPLSSRRRVRETELSLVTAIDGRHDRFSPDIPVVDPEPQLATYYHAMTDNLRRVEPDENEIERKRKEVEEQYNNISLKLFESEQAEDVKHHLDIYDAAQTKQLTSDGKVVEIALIPSPFERRRDGDFFIKYKATANGPTYHYHIDAEGRLKIGVQRLDNKIDEPRDATKAEFDRLTNGVQEFLVAA